MNILLTGAGGQLGRELAPLLAPLGRVIAVDRAPGPGLLEQDLGDLDRLQQLLDRLRPELIVNAAAYTAVDRAETEAVAAYRVNAELPAGLAAWAAGNDALLLHYSTDYVFAGDARRPYREDDPTGPLNVYGESKLAGEKAVADSGCRHLLLRTSWVYSGHGHNFLLTMLRLARERASLRVVNDQLGRPTWARNLARVSAALIGRVSADAGGAPRRGTWHYCDSGLVSWYDFAGMIFAAAVDAGVLQQAPELNAVGSDDFPQAAERPRYSVLDTTRIREEFDIEPAGLEASIRACIGELGNNA